MKYRAIAVVLTLVMLLSAFSFTVASATELVDTSSRFTDVIDGNWYMPRSTVADFVNSTRSRM